MFAKLLGLVTPTGVMWAILIGVVVIGYNVRISAAERAGYAQAESVYRLKLARQTADAQQRLIAEQDLVRETERALRAARAQQEVKDATNQKELAALSNQLRALLNDAGQLRDPNAAPERCGGAAPGQPAAVASGSADDGAQTGGLLSPQLTGLLQRLTEEADAINVAYISCRADAIAQQAQEH